MVRLVIVLLLTFSVFIGALIALTRKEEAIEKEIRDGNVFTEGTLVRSVRSGSSIDKELLKYIYEVTYTYEVQQSVYKVKTKIEVESDCPNLLPKSVNVLYSKTNPKNALVSMKEEIKGMQVKETVKSLFPAILISCVVGFILFYFLVVNVIKI